MSFSLVALRCQGRSQYRWYTIQNIPSLKILDFERITQTERHRAQKFWANSASGGVLTEQEEEEDKVEYNNNKNNKTFTPGEGASAEESFVVNFTKEEKEQIRQMVANANSSQEIEEIERSVKRGIFPRIAALPTTTTTTTTTTNGTSHNNNNNRKRPVSEDESTTTTTLTETVIAKKAKTESK